MPSTAPSKATGPRPTLWTNPVSRLHEILKPAIDHALGIERQRFGVHHAGQPLVGHHPGVDAVALRARLVGDPGKYHRLARLELDAAREGGELADLDVVCHPFAVIQRAMLAPDLAGLLRHAAVGGKVLLRHRDDKSIDVRHRHSLPLSLNRRARLWIMSGNWWRRPASGRFRQPGQSTWTPAALTTFSHFSVSATIILPKASGGPISGSPPRSISLALIAGSASTALISLFIFSMISAGVFFGTPIPNSALAS